MNVVLQYVWTNKIVKNRSTDDKVNRGTDTIKFNTVTSFLCDVYLIAKMC